MQTSGEEVDILNEEFPQLNDARYAWTLHSIWRLTRQFKSGDLRVDSLRMGIKKKADEIIRDANSFRVVMGFSDDLDFFVHPDLRKTKKAAEDRIKRKMKYQNDRKLANRILIEAKQSMRRQNEKEKKEAEEEEKHQNLRDSLKSLTLTGEDLLDPSGELKKEHTISEAIGVFVTKRTKKKKRTSKECGTHGNDQENERIEPAVKTKNKKKCNQNKARNVISLEEYENRDKSTKP